MLDKVPLIGSVGTGFGNNPLASAPTVNTPDLETAAKDFVAMLYTKVFETMRTSHSDDENGLFSGEQSGMFMGYLDREIGRKFAHSRDGNGLASQLIRQLKQGLPQLELEGKDLNDKASLQPGVEAGNKQIQEVEQSAINQDAPKEILAQLVKINKN